MVSKEGPGGGPRARDHSGWCHRRRGIRKKDAGEPGHSVGDRNLQHTHTRSPPSRPRPEADCQPPSPTGGLEVGGYCRGAAARRPARPHAPAIWLCRSHLELHAHRTPHAGYVQRSRRSAEACNDRRGGETERRRRHCAWLVNIWRLRFGQHQARGGAGA